MASANRTSGRRRSLRVKFPRTRRDRSFEFEDEREAPESGAGPWGGPEGPPLDNTYTGQDMQQYPMPPPKNVSWADVAETETDKDPYLPREGLKDGWNKDCFGGEREVPLAANQDSWSDAGALSAKSQDIGGQQQDLPVANGSEARPWIRIQPTGDDSDSAPVQVLGPPGRTPPPLRRGLQAPEDSDDDDDDDNVFIDEQVPTIVFDDPPMTMHPGVDPTQPYYGRYIPPEYQHTLEYLYGLETIREVDESLLHGQQKPWKEEASDWDMFCIILSLIAYLLNVAADIWLAFEYFHYGHYWWFGLTLTFVLLPSMAMTLFSLVLYLQDLRILNDKVSAVMWVLRAFFLILLVAPVMRIIDTIRFGIKSRRAEDWRERRHWYQRMRDEDTDSNLVRLFETFVENAPQLVLQMYILMMLGNSEGMFLVVVQITGLVISLMAMAWSLVGFQSALRSSLHDKAEMKMGGKTMMFIWRVMTISARVVALALFASYFKYWVLLVMGVHLVIMFGWMTKQNTTYCMLKVKEEGGGEMKTYHSRFLEFLFRLMAAFVHVFCFFNLLESHTRLRCLFYYTLVYVENAAMILSWFISASTIGSSGWYQMPALGLVIGGFFVGIIFQIMYYMWCHPNNSSEFHFDRRIRWWVPCKELSLFNSLEFPETCEMEPTKKAEDAASDVARSDYVKSDYGRSEVSSFGPANAPVETSTPAPSTIGGATLYNNNVSPVHSPPKNETSSVKPLLVKERPAPAAEGESPPQAVEKSGRTPVIIDGDSTDHVRLPPSRTSPQRIEVQEAQGNTTSAKVTEV